MGRIFSPDHSEQWKRKTPNKPIKCGGVEFIEGGHSFGGSSIGASFEVHIEHPHRRVTHDMIMFRAMKVLEDHLDELVDIDPELVPEERFGRGTYEYEKDEKDGSGFTSRRRRRSRRGLRRRRPEEKQDESWVPPAWR